MKNPLRIVFALLLLPGPILIEACQSNACECCAPPTPYSITDITVLTSSEGADASTPKPTSIKPKLLQFYFNVSYEVMQEGNDQPDNNCRNIVWNTISVEKFAALKITSNATLITKDGRTFNSGDNISTLFSLNNFAIGEPLSLMSFQFIPNFSVGEKTQQRFTFIITLDDGRTFELQDGPFELLPD